MVRLAMGTPSLLVDLVDPNSNLKPTLDKRQLVLPGTTFTPKGTGGSFSGVKVIGTVFSRAYASRNDEVSYSCQIYLGESWLMLLHRT